MSDFRMPVDDNGNPVPCITLKEGGAHKILNVSSSAAAKNTVPFQDDTVVISLYADNPVYIKFLDGPNDTPATADDHYYPAGVYYNFHLGGRVGASYAAGTNTPNKKYISILAVSSTANVYVSECF